MPGSMHAFGLAALAVAGCAQTSQPPGTLAPATRVSAATLAGTDADPATAAPASLDPSSVPTAEEAASGVTREGDGGVGAQFRSCHADADCVAVPRPGCCRNGWKEAVAASQADAYASSNPCTWSPRPACPMYMVRDPRVARCDPQTQLCTMVRP